MGATHSCCCTCDKGMAYVYVCDVCVRMFVCICLCAHVCARTRAFVSVCAIMHDRVPAKLLLHIP